MGSRRHAVVAILLGTGCGPGAVGGSGTEHGTTQTSETSESSESSESGETGEPPDFPELPEPVPGCLERGGVHALIGEPRLIFFGEPETLTPSDLAATEDGLLAFFRYDQDPNVVRTAWSARLDDHGSPLGEPFELMERDIADGPRAHAHDDGFMLTFRGLWGADYRAAAVAIDELGVPLADELRRQPQDRYCCIAGGGPDGIWTGQRHLIGWRDNSSGPVPGHELLMDVFTSDGTSSGWVQLQDDGEFDPRPSFVVTSEAAFMISSAGDDGVMLHRFDAAGNWLPDQAVNLEVPADLSPYNTGDAAMAANADGFVIWLEEDNTPHRAFRWHLDPEGQVLDGPIEMLPPSPEIHDSNFDLVATPSGYALAAVRGDWTSSIVVTMLDTTGAPMDTVEIAPSPDGGLWSSGLAQRGDSTFILYESRPTDTNDELLVAEIGCVEP